MNPRSAAAPPPRGQLWAGRILSGLAIAFLAMDSVMKLVRAQPAVEATVQLGYPGSIIVPLGILLLSCTAVYAIPRTSVLGAILLTGYLGGAVASQVRVGNPLFTHVLFPVYIGVLIWAGLVLRNRRVRTVLLPNE